MINKKIPTNKLFAIQARITTGKREYWDWLLENWYDGEGQLYVTSSMKSAAYRKRKLERKNHGSPWFKEFRIVRIRFKRDVGYDMFEERYMAQVHAYLQEKGLRNDFSLWSHRGGDNNGMGK